MSGEIASDEPAGHNSAGGPGQLGPWAELAELTALARVSSQPLSPIPDDVLSEIRDFAEMLRTLFGALGMSLNRLAAMLHSDPGTVSRYLSGKRVPPPDFIDALCKVVYDTKGSLVTPHVQELVHEQFLVALRVHNPARYEVQRLTDLLQAAAQQKRQYEITVAALEEAIASRNDKIYALELESRQLRTAWARAERLLEEEREHREHLQHTIDNLYTEVGYFKEQLLSAQRRAAAAEERCQQLEARLDSAGALLEDEEQRTAPKVTTGPPEAPETPALQPRDLTSDWAAAAGSAVPDGGSAGARALGDTSRVRAGSIGVPVVWGDVPARNRNFTGREDVLHPGFRSWCSSLGRESGG
jgi:transcriptional regulator with XRE-family HTH domain